LGIRATPWGKEFGFYHGQMMVKKEDEAAVFASVVTRDDDGELDK